MNPSTTTFTLRIVQPVPSRSRRTYTAKMKITGSMTLVGERIRPWIQQIADDVQHEWAQVTPYIYFHSNNAFPLGASLTFLTSPVSDELAAVSIDGHRKGDVVVLTSDVADGHGMVFADGPSCTISALIEDPAEVLALVSPWLDELRTFLAVRGLEETKRLVQECLARDAGA